MSHFFSDALHKNQAPVLDGASITLQGTVEKIIPSSMDGSNAVQIVIEGAENLYREIRIQNLLQDGDGNVVALNPGSEVEITIRVRNKK